jgi:hypothetical protein
MQVEIRSHLRAYDANPLALYCNEGSEQGSTPRHAQSVLQNVVLSGRVVIGKTIS